MEQKINAIYAEANTGIAAVIPSKWKTFKKYLGWLTTGIIGFGILYNEVLPRMGLLSKKTMKHWLINFNVIRLFY